MLRIKRDLLYKLIKSALRFYKSTRLVFTSKQNTEYTHHWMWKLHQKCVIIYRILKYLGEVVHSQPLKASEDYVPASEK